MFSLNKALKHLIIITSVFLLLVAFFKINSFNLPLTFIFIYFFLSLFLLQRNALKARKYIYKNIEDNYPDVYKKLSSKLLGYDLGISSLRFGSLISFGNSTGIEEIDWNIKKYKQLNYKSAFVLFFVLIIIALSSIICKVT